MRPLILFDMDGTLLNSVPAIGESCNRALAENGLPQYPIPAYNGMVGNGMRVLIGRACPAGAAEEEELTLEQAAQRAFALTSEGFSASAAAKTAAQGTAYSKSEVYKQLLLLQQTAE